jgi:hypothetical protein
LPQPKEEEIPEKRAVRHPKSGAQVFGSSLVDAFSAPAYECRVVDSDQSPEFAVTRLRFVFFKARVRLIGSGKECSKRVYVRYFGCFWSETGKQS